MGEFKKTCLVLFAVAVLAAACTSEPEPSAAAQQGAGRVGGADSACKLPLSFDLADKWSPEAVDQSGAPTQGGFTLVCEIDAKPAGHIGFLRVWTSKKTGSAREALDAFLTDDSFITVPEHSAPQVASTTAAEVTYVRDNPKADAKKRERTLTVSTPSGAVLLALGGFDDEEHKNMLPALELAKKSMRIP